MRSHRILIYLIFLNAYPAFGNFRYTCWPQGNAGGFISFTEKTLHGRRFLQGVAVNIIARGKISSPNDLPEWFWKFTWGNSDPSEWFYEEAFSIGRIVEGGQDNPNLYFNHSLFENFNRGVPASRFKTAFILEKGDGRGPLYSRYILRERSQGQILASLEFICHRGK